MDLISVIVPVYNVEPYLDRCVQSIVDQTYQNLEIILVDDGSPDRCPVMCDAWAEKDSRIKVIHKENGGLSDARNAGMNIARGMYIAFVDSDDWVAEDYIGAMAGAIADTGAALAACDIRFVQEGETVLEDTSSATYRVCASEEALDELVHGCGFRAVAWNKLYHRSLLQDIRYPMGKHHEDEFVTYRVLARADKLVYVEKSLYFYLQRQGSIMHSFSIKRLDVLDAYLERLAFFRERYPDIYLYDKATFCASCASFYCTALDSKMRESARFRDKIRHQRKAVRFSPEEFRQLTMKQKMYVFGTGWFMDIFCRALYLRTGGGE